MAARLSGKIGGAFAPVLPEEAHPVTVEDGGDVFLGVPALAKDRREQTQVGDGVKVFGALLAPEAAVEVASDADETARAQQLADMVDVVGDVAQRESVWAAGAFDPARDQHPGVERDPDDATPAGDDAKLRVVELALVRDQRPAVGVADVHGTREALERFPEAFIREVGEIQGEALARRGVQQLAAEVGEAASCPGPPA